MLGWPSHFREVTLVSEASHPSVEVWLISKMIVHSFQSGNELCCVKMRNFLIDSPPQKLYYILTL